MQSQLIEAKETDVDQIVEFLMAMSDELEEFAMNKSTTKQSVSQSLKEYVHWFLFIDENQKPFGTCYLQSVHNYWRAEKRYYLGGFYITPSHRGKGRFKAINKQLKKWADDMGGTQIYAHIHKDNEKSLKTFAAVDFEEVDYRLCANHWGD